MYSPLRCETIECARRGEQFGIPGSRDKCIRDERGGGEGNRILSCAFSLVRKQKRRSKDSVASRRLKSLHSSFPNRKSNSSVLSR